MMSCCRSILMTSTNGEAGNRHPPSCSFVSGRSRGLTGFLLTIRVARSTACDRFRRLPNRLYVHSCHRWRWYRKRSRSQIPLPVRVLERRHIAVGPSVTRPGRIEVTEFWWVEQR